MRQAQGVAEFMSHTADEDLIVFSQRNATVLAVTNNGLFQLQVPRVELRRIQLPRRPAFVRTARVVRRLMSELKILFIPRGQIAQDQNRFVVWINVRGTQHWDTFVADF